MATGWPMKTTYANGDVYSASDVNDITGTINLLQTSTLSSQAGKNAVINGGMDVWQRGTSFTTTGVYTADRWFTGTNTGQTLSRQTTSDTTNLPSIQYCLRAQRNNTTTNTNIVGIAQSIETINSIPYAGKTVTLSFYARKGANLSGTFTATLYSGTGTDQRRDFGAGFTGEATVVTSSPTLTTTWARYTLTGTVATTATELAALIYFVPAGTAGAADYFEVTGVQVELGSYATTFSRAGGSIGGELALCQRYYWQYSSNTSWVGMGTYVSSSFFAAVITYPTTMRSNPTLTSTTGTNYYQTVDSGTTDGLNSITIYLSSPDTAYLYNNTDAAGTAYRPAFLMFNNASAKLGFDSEL